MCKVNIIKKWQTYGYRGRVAGFRCIIECNHCGKKKELTYGLITAGFGKFCSKECHYSHDREPIVEKEKHIIVKSDKICRICGDNLTFTDVKQRRTICKKHNCIRIKNLQLELA